MYLYCYLFIQCLQLKCDKIHFALWFSENLFSRPWGDCYELLGHITVYLSGDILSCYRGWVMLDNADMLYLYINHSAADWKILIKLCWRGQRMIKLLHNENAGRMFRAVDVVVSRGADKPVAAVKHSFCSRWLSYDMVLMSLQWVDLIWVKAHLDDRCQNIKRHPDGEKEGEMHGSVLMFFNPCAATTCRRGNQTHGSDFIGCICGADSEY